MGVKKYVNVNKFVKIKGYKKLIICRECGKKIFSKKHSHYCKRCLNNKKKKII